MLYEVITNDATAERVFDDEHRQAGVAGLVLGREEFGGIGAPDAGGEELLFELLFGHGGIDPVWQGRSRITSYNVCYTKLLRCAAPPSKMPRH